jgi:type VI secretion system protein ImpG
MNVLEHYNEELRHLRESGARFAKEHPQVAGQLGLHPDAVTDPFVERLLEGVAFLSARVHARLDHECAEFAQQALHGLSPLYMSATPSISCFAFHPDFESPEAFTGRTIDKGSVVQAFLGERTQPIQFMTAREVTLWPMRLSSAQCMRSITNVPRALEAKLTTAQGIVRMRFEMEGTTRIADLRGATTLKPINLCIAGDLPNAYALHRTLLADTGSWFALFNDDNVFTELPRHALRMAGLEDEQSLLPQHEGGMHGLRLLREYFAQPERYLGLDMDVLTRLAAFRPNARSFELIFALKRVPASLIGNVDKAQLRLFATPVINLYQRRLDPVPYDTSKTEQWVPVDRMRPQAQYLWSVSDVNVCHRNGKVDQAMSAVAHARFEENAARARYGLKRSAVDVMQGGRSARLDPLNSHDTLSISLLDQTCDLEDVTTLLVKGWVVDRDWTPKALLEAKLSLKEARAVSQIECLWPGSAPRPIPPLETSWDAVSRLSSNPLAMSRPGRENITQQVMAYLKQAAQAGDVLDEKRLESIRSVHIRAGHVRSSRSAPMAWVRCMHVEIDIDTSHHADQGAWMFGRLVAQALSHSITLNDGVEVKLLLDGELVSTHLNTDRADGVLE